MRNPNRAWVMAAVSAAIIGLFYLLREHWAHMFGVGRRQGNRRHHPDAQRCARRGIRHPPLTGHAAQDQAEPVLGIYLQQHWHTDCCLWLPQSHHRSGGDGAELALRHRQLGLAQASEVGAVMMSVLPSRQRAQFTDLCCSPVRSTPGVLGSTRSDDGCDWSGRYCQSNVQP